MAKFVPLFLCGLAAAAAQPILLRSPLLEVVGTSAGGLACGRAAALALYSDHAGRNQVLGCRGDSDSRGCRESAGDVVSGRAPPHESEWMFIDGPLSSFGALVPIERM